MAFLCECLALIFFSAWATKTTTKSCFNVGKLSLHLPKPKPQSPRVFTRTQQPQQKLCICCVCMYGYVNSCMCKPLPARVGLCACSYLSYCMFDIRAMFAPRRRRRCLDGAIIKCGSHAKRVRENFKLANNFIIVFTIIFIIITIVIFAIAVN